MIKKHDFRYDPLYRIIDETDEMKNIEGNYYQLFERLKGISNLGLIPEVVGMARYPKYEHGIGTIHQVNSLLDNADNEIIPDKYRKPLKVASLFLHNGHLPYTYSTERSVLLACNLGIRDTKNRIKKYIEKKIKKPLEKINAEDEVIKNTMEGIFSLRNYKNLYKFLSAGILIEKWSNVKKKVDLEDEDLEITIKDLIDPKNDGYKYLDLADKADYVQRDALYFGTVQLDISPKHLYSELSRYKPKFSVSEEKLIEYNLYFLTERFYDEPKIDCFSRLYEKILASLIISKNFNFMCLENYNDAELKRLICDGLDKENNRVELPQRWRNHAKNLFNKEFEFSTIFEIDFISFPKEKDIIDVEYEIIGKRESERGLLFYPFDQGVLLSINYSKPSPDNKYPYFVHTQYRAYRIRLFQYETNKSLYELLNIIKNISHYLSITHVENIRKGLAGQLSWTRETRFSNEAVIQAIAEAIESLENDVYQKHDFIEKYLKSISSISTFGELWHNSENQFIWKGQIVHFLQHHRKELEKGKIYETFTEGLLSLPVQLFQYKSTKRYLDEIYDKLLENISSDISDDKRGGVFEALCLINKIRTKSGQFQFFLNGMVVIDLDKPRNNQDENEFDVIELCINDNGKAECWVYACSIADDYKSKNKEQLDKLTEHIHEVFPDLILRTRYIIPQNKNDGNWSPNEEDAGRNYN